MATSLRCASKCMQVVRSPGTVQSCPIRCYAEQATNPSRRPDVTASGNVPVTQKQQAVGRRGRHWSWPTLSRLDRDPISALTRDFDRLRDDLFGGLTTVVGDLATETEQALNVAIDIHEEKDKYVTTAEMSLPRENVSVQVIDHTLVIRGSKSEDRDNKGWRFWRRERIYGEFERRFELPDDADTDKIRATYNNGVLRIELPKTASTEVTPKDVKIE
eukprot:TRINITY_DN3970_c0_g1_i2.p1 TRINITY_DN3970_c0_g1~~TRINITY_DN3970_c0_g1_i2.p1  ORF type:complete len:245 (-),score=61.81 TRINITY_DN3970_c0_g1_i2:182-832(-)